MIGHPHYSDLPGILLGSMTEGVIATDAAGRVLFMNPAAQELTGWQEDEARGLSCDDVLTFLCETAQQPDADLMHQTHADQLMMQRVETRKVSTRDGRQIAIENRTAPLRDRNGVLIGSVLVLRNDEVRMRTESALRLTIEDLRHSNEELQFFANAAAHDLRSPLSTISVMSQLLASKRGTATDSDMAEWAGCITRNIRRMLRLIDDLMSHGNVLQLNRQSACSSLDEALAEVREMLAAELEAKPAMITSENLPVVAIAQTHAVLLLQNLIGNALKYCREQSPAIHVMAELKSDYWEVRVRDNGIGVDPAFSDFIFLPFKRLHGQEIPGSGIGLATCRKIVEAYGGDIWLDPLSAQGATFCFTLPRAR